MVHRYGHIMLSGTDAYTLLQWMLLVLQIIILWHKVVCIQAYEEGQHKRYYFWKRTWGNITSHLQAVCSLVSVILSTVCVCVCEPHAWGMCFCIEKCCAHVLVQLQEKHAADKSTQLGVLGRIGRSELRLVCSCNASNANKASNFPSAIRYH